MSHINFVGFSGNLGGDAQVETTNTGKAKVVFSLANNREFKVNGESRKQTSWFRCIWYTSPEHGVIPLLTKGKGIFVQGRMEAREYEQDGQRKTIHEVYVNDIKLMSDGGPAREMATVGASTSNLFDNDEELPF